jgi:hypothetical protein
MSVTNTQTNRHHICEKKRRQEKKKAQTTIAHVSIPLAFLRLYRKAKPRGQTHWPKRNYHIQTTVWKTTKHSPIKKDHMSYFLSSFTVSDRPLSGECETTYPIEMMRIAKQTKKPQKIYHLKTIIKT